MEKSENIEFYKVGNLNKSFFKLIPYSIDSSYQKTNFHVKINKRSEKIRSEKIRSDEKDHLLSDDQFMMGSGHNDQIINKIKKKYPIIEKKFSTIKYFDFLIEKIPKLSLKQKKILFEKFKNLKSRKKELFFYFDKKKLILLFQKYIFRNGISLIKSLLTHNLTKIKNKKKILKFHNLLFKPN